MKKPGREFYKLFGSFLMLLVLPLLLFGSIYLRSNANVEKTVTVAAGESLSRDAAAAEASVKEMRRSISMLVTSETLRALSHVEIPNPSERYSYSMAQDELLRLTNSFPEIRDICVWFPMGRSALNTNARFGPEQLEYLASVYYRSEFAALEENLFGLPTGYHIYQGTDGVGELVYVQRLGIGDRAAVVAARLKPSVLAPFTNGGSERYGEQRAIGLDGMIWSGDLKEKTPDESAHVVPALPGFESCRGELEGQDSLILAAESRALKIKWLSAVPYRTVRQESRYILRTALLFTVLYVLGGAGIAWLFARRRYDPLKKIMDALTAEDEGSGEYTRIEQSLARLQRRSERAEYALEQSVESVRSGYLRRLLRGDAGIQNAAIYGADFGEDRWFGLLLFSVSDYGDQFSASGEVDDRTSEALLYSVRNVAEESARCRCQTFVYREQAVCLFSDPTAEIPAAEMERVAAETVAFFREKLGVVLMAGRSGIAEGAEQLPALWRELTAGQTSNGKHPASAEDAAVAAAENQTDILLRYVAEHCCEPDFSLGAVAERFGMNPSYLSRKFKSEVGAGFGEYVQSLRFAKAKQLLQDTDQPVALVAEAVGYFSVSAFTAAFRKNIGVSPAAYRNEK